jgi:hypothetical protein
MAVSKGIPLFEAMRFIDELELGFAATEAVRNFHGS